MLERKQAIGKRPLVTAKGQPVTDCSIQSHPDTSKISQANIQSPSQRVAKLIGEKCVLKCNLSGYAVTALLDSGVQVSIIDRQWKQRYLPQQEVRPLCELLGDSELDLTAANGEPIPYDGWVEFPSWSAV